MTRIILPSFWFIAFSMLGNAAASQEMKICWEDGAREFCITNESATFTYTMVPGDRIEYESQYSTNAGKVRSIGPVRIEYESQYSTNAGKVRSIGPVRIEYESQYSANAGKIKKVGGMRIEYESQYSPNAGKIRRTIGQVK